MKNSRIIIAEEELKIVEYYKTHTKKNTSITFHRDVRTIQKILINHGCKIRTHEEELEISKAAARQTCIAKYGVDNPQKAEEIKNKTVETNIKKYGVKSYLATEECQSKSHEACLKKYGTEIFLTLPESKELAKKTMIERYGVAYAMQDEILKAKKYDTQKQNNHMNTSEPEKIFYEKLLQYFAVDDIIQQYKEDRYPFFCDFYIKSLDLFIEINHFYTHQTHPFDENDKEDLEKVKEFKQKG